VSDSTPRKSPLSRVAGADGSGPAAAAARPGRIAELIEKIKESADKLASDRTSRGDLKILSRALRELRYAFKVFALYRSQRKVTIFGSARTGAEQPAYRQAVEFGRAMANHVVAVIAQPFEQCVIDIEVGAILADRRRHGRQLAKQPLVVLQGSHARDYIRNSVIMVTNFRNLRNFVTSQFTISDCFLYLSKVGTGCAIRKLKINSTSLWAALTDKGMIMKTGKFADAMAIIGVLIVVFAVTSAATTALA